IYYIVTGDQMPAERPKGDKTDKIVLGTPPAK
ncbi:MAG: phosphate transport system regulatory protein PhoU, partial [Mesorhizobium sp.]